MKLTKGKISKLYNKNNQSLKKNIKKNILSESKTFRRKQNVNLDRKSLKRVSKKYVGGLYQAETTHQQVIPSNLQQEVHSTQQDVISQKAGTQNETNHLLNYNISDIAKNKFNKIILNMSNKINSGPQILSNLINKPKIY